MVKDVATTMAKLKVLLFIVVSILIFVMDCDSGFDAPVASVAKGHCGWSDHQGLATETAWDQGEHQPCHLAKHLKFGVVGH